MHGRWACVVGGQVWWGACMVGGTHGRRDGHCSGLYASYWNAFLLYVHLSLILYMCPDSIIVLYLPFINSIHNSTIFNFFLMSDFDFASAIMNFIRKSNFYFYISHLITLTTCLIYFYISHLLSLLTFLFLPFINFIPVVNYFKQIVRDQPLPGVMISKPTLRKTYPVMNI